MSEPEVLKGIRLISRRFIAAEQRLHQSEAEALDLREGVVKPLKSKARELQRSADESERTAADAKSTILDVLNENGFQDLASDLETKSPRRFGSSAAAIEIIDEMKDAAQVCRKSWKLIQEAIRELQVVREQREKSRRSFSRRFGCVIAVGLTVGIMVAILGTAIAYIRNSATDAVSEAEPSISEPVSASANATATADALVPRWIGTSIEMRAKLDDVSENRFRIEYEVINRTGGEYTLSLLSSDIAVSDSAGSIYQSRSSTRPIQATISTGQSTVFTQDYEGTLSPNITYLTTDIEQIGGEDDISLEIPLLPLTDAIAVELGLDYVRDNGFGIEITIDNSGISGFISRFAADTLVVTDDIGNQYRYANESDEDRTLAILLNPSGSYRNSVDYRWMFTPGIDPGATELKMILRDFMGKQFTSTEMLAAPSAEIRYEAAIRYTSADSFGIYFVVFNIGSTDFIARFNEQDSYVMSNSGNTYRALDGRRRVASIRPGDSMRYIIGFGGLPTGQEDLALIIPVLSGLEDIQIPIKPEDL